jgi:hypothetical protein
LGAVVGVTEIGFVCVAFFAALLPQAASTKASATKPTPQRRLTTWPRAL